VNLVLKEVEKNAKKIRDAHNGGAIHDTLKCLVEECGDIEVRHIGTLEMPECGLTDEILNDTDVLIWWSHVAHDQVPYEVVFRVQEHVQRGMGIIFLHSAHHSKLFKTLMGTSCNLHWRESEDKEYLWVIDPSHPIAEGIPEHVTIPMEEMYGEPFGIPEPDKLVFIGSFSPGEVFRSGCCWRREYGKVFYFQPGHESHPTYHIPEIQKIIKNAINWAYSSYRVAELTCPNVEKPQD